MAKKKQKPVMSFYEAVERSLLAFYKEMEKCGYKRFNLNWGRYTVTDSRTRGRRTEHGTTYGFVVEKMRDIFIGPKGSVL